MPQISESVRFEAYGPGGSALIVDCLTDSRDRTVEQLRGVLLRYGGNVGAHGSVSYLFNEVGRLVFPPVNGKRLIRAALEAGAEDVVAGSDGSVEVLVDPIEFGMVRARLQGSGFIPTTAEVTQHASMPVLLKGDAAVAMARLLEALEDLNDVENVYTNAEIPDEVLARF